MSIEKNFSRQIKRMERMPQRALYRQTRSYTRSLEKSIFKKGKTKKSGNTGRKIAIEVLWFFSSAILALLIAFMLFYLFSHFSTRIMNIGIYATGSIYHFFYFLVILCFVGIYIIRLINWAIKKLTINN